VADDSEGGPLGGMIERIADAMHAGHERIRPAQSADKLAHLTHVLETIEQEYGPVLQPLVQHVLDDPNTPEQVRGLLAPLVEPTNLGQSLILGIAIGAVISPVLGAATAPFVQGIANNVWSHDTSVPLSPAELAVAVLKGVLTEAQAAPEASQSGISGSRFHTMVQNVGNAIGIQEALLLLRRNQITEAEFARIVHYSNIRSDFLPDILKLRYAPVSAAEAIAGALKQQLTPDEAKQKVSEAGIDPDQFEWMLATAGRPYGIQQALHLWNRGLIDEARVREVIAHSDVNPTFTDDILHLRVYLPPPRSVVPMLRHGGITEAQARDLLAKNGVPPEFVDGFIAEAGQTKTNAAKTLTESTVIRMFLAATMDEATARARLSALGYTAGDVDLLLQLANDQKRERYAGAIITRMHTLYVSHKADAVAVRTALSKDGIDAASTNDLLALWDVERAANVHVPSVAMVLHAYRQKYITPAECKRRLIALGVQSADMGIVVANALPPTHTPPEVTTFVNAVLDA
jgi:hypothetical protein